ncbi:MAG TPA: tryptophan synthase subunit alpha [Pseudonocardiaceae bacterium]|jgi:tryptophan synthase alpha chain
MNHSIGPVEAALRRRRDAGGKLLVVYVTGGVSENWPDHVRAIRDAGADAVEIGIPFSDPVIDGPVIQQATMRALDRGTTPESLLAELAGTDLNLPLIAMTYYNLVAQAGHRDFADRLVAAGIRAAILPDLPLGESAEWESDAAVAGVETVLLAAPVTPDDRLRAICARSRGFVYGMGLMGVTGERAAPADSAVTMAARLTAMTDKPVLIGVGVSNPDNAARIAAVADGVIIGAPVMRRIVDGAPTGEIATMVTAFRTALDGVAK